MWILWKRYCPDFTKYKLSYVDKTYTPFRRHQTPILTHCVGRYSSDTLQYRGTPRSIEVSCHFLIPQSHRWCYRHHSPDHASKLQISLSEESFHLQDHPFSDTDRKWFYARYHIHMLWLFITGSLIFRVYAPDIIHVSCRFFYQRSRLLFYLKWGEREREKPYFGEPSCTVRWATVWPSRDEDFHIS